MKRRVSLPTYTPTPTFIVEATVLPTQAQPTPTIDVSSLEIQEDPPSLLPFEGSFSGLILGTVLAGFIVMIAIGIRYGIRAIKKNDS